MIDDDRSKHFRIDAATAKNEAKSVQRKQR
jgi:hypothetical protein